MADQPTKCLNCGYDLRGLPTAQCPECGAVCDSAAMARANRRRLLLVAIMMALAFYGPYSWVLWIDYPWDEYRWHWVNMWPAMPLLLPATITLRSLFAIEVDEAIAIWVTAAVCAALLYLLIRIAAKGWSIAALVSLIVLVGSCVHSWMLYHAFLM